MITTKNIHNALVWKENYNTRWLYAMGESVSQFISQNGTPVDANTDPAGWVNTETGTNSILNSATPGSWWTVTTGGTEYNGVNLQLRTSAFNLTTGVPCYFGIKCALQNATKPDFLVGLCEVDTTLMATSGAHAVSVTDDGVYFSKLSGSTSVYFSNELGGTVGSSAVGTADTSAHVYEIYYDGTLLKAYYDDSLITTITTGIADQALTPSINFRAGDDGAEVLEVSWLRAIRLG